LGSFSVGLGTVYREQSCLKALKLSYSFLNNAYFEDHEFNGKWAPIIPEAVGNDSGVVSVAGYLKCDIGIQSVNESFKVSL
jgi:hypothetical protein